MVCWLAGLPHAHLHGARTRQFGRGLGLASARIISNKNHSYSQFFHFVVNLYQGRRVAPGPDGSGAGGGKNTSGMRFAMAMHGLTKASYECGKPERRSSLICCKAAKKAIERMNTINPDVW
jgi:hypothetical protein